MTAISQLSRYEDKLRRWMLSQGVDFRSRFPRNTRRTISTEEAYVMGAAWIQQLHSDIQYPNVQRAYLLGLRRGYRYGSTTKEEK